MIKKIIAGVALILAFVTASAVPAQASVPEWDTVHSAAEWASIKTVLNSTGDLAYAQNLPASPLAMQAKASGDCNPPPPVGTQEYLCLWNGYNFTGTVWKIPVNWLQNGSPVNGISFLGSGIDNYSKSWWNRTYLTVRLFDRNDCQNSGWYRNLTSDAWAVSYDPNTNDWDNVISSASTIYDAGNYCFADPYA